MCSANDDPSMIDPPGWNAATAPMRPRRYVLSGDVQPVQPRPSVALATLGTLITEFEKTYERSGRDPEIALELSALRLARDEVARAEAEYADGTVRG